jgi:hypothetical protein
MDTTLDQEPVDDRCYAQRKFPKSHVCINMYILDNHQIEVNMENNIFTEAVPGGTAYMTITYDDTDNIPLYNLIKIVFDKITEDTSCSNEYIDFVRCSNWLQSKLGVKRVELTQESCSYIKPYKSTEHALPNNTIIIHGNIDMSGVFTYDYPIVCYNESPEYYKISRGRHWDDIDYDKTYNRFFVISETSDGESPYTCHEKTKLKHFEHCCVFQQYNTPLYDFEFHLHGCIELYRIDYNKFYCVVDHGFDIKKNVIVEISQVMSVFQSIQIILEKIDRVLFEKSNCFHYSPTQQILCSDKFVQEHPQLCNYNIQNNYYGCEYMEFNEDTVKYLDYVDGDYIDLQNVVYMTLDASGILTSNCREEVEDPYTTA